MRAQLIPKKPIMVIALACQSAGGKGTVRGHLERLAQVHQVNCISIGSTELRLALNCSSQASRDEIRQAMNTHPLKDEFGFPFTLYVPQIVPRCTSVPTICIVDGLRRGDQADYLQTIFPNQHATVTVVWIDRPFDQCRDALVSRDGLTEAEAIDFLLQEKSGAAPCIDLESVRNMAHHNLSNCDGLDELYGRVERFWRSIVWTGLDTRQRPSLTASEGHAFLDHTPCGRWLTECPPRGNDS
ncbi:MAG: hypothetical protein CEO22_85 [Candidatus Berkelbacteria bacterium Gr01-1014_85]|uniref:Uncharacterized protein n=1 Tax=Candidatus Berkelbacteria bacterium Gr01-1014_85 TaxID=2017150 RepID=A0A554JDV8_9BACT|nr:MAG: hypothetical protein CEO22_85 [Candidatus Berkelbacteria bacterium Gr01-1014_85]